MKGKTVIDIHDVCKIYNENTIPVHAINHVHLHIQKGEFTALVGPSGSGKTTLLNVMGGLDKPSSGEVIIRGTNITKLSVNALIDFRLRNIGFVFQAFNLLPVLSAAENVEFIMLLQGVPKQDRDLRVEALMRSIGLEDKMHVRPAELSGGQQQRVAVARALASKPQFVLADEPTANLDTQAANNLLDMMSRLNEQEHMTFIFSTHDARVIERARRVVTLVDGRIVGDTSSMDIAHD